MKICVLFARAEGAHIFLLVIVPRLSALFKNNLTGSFGSFNHQNHENLRSISSTEGAC